MGFSQLGIEGSRIVLIYLSFFCLTLMLKCEFNFPQVLDFVNDAIITLDAFADAYQPAALSLCASFERG